MTIQSSFGSIKLATIQCKVGDKVNVSAQMLKGVLEGCILKIISTKETYGYEICEELVIHGFEGISEGSVYPILLRLEKKGLISFKKEKSPYGPIRKYYYITSDGSIYLDEFLSDWSKIQESVNNVLKE